MKRQLVWGAFCLAVIVGACGGEDPAAVSGSGAENEEQEESSAEYQVVLANAVSDTLSGSATFGAVLHPGRNARQLVIRLRSSYDFAGGVVITRRGTALPEEGTYDLTADSAAYAAGDQFIIIYREGMLRDLRSVSGTLTIESASDTLIAGSFDAMMRGYVSEGALELLSADVHAVGRFEAEQGMAGYVIGM